MLVVLKNLRQETFQVEIDASNTVQQLKDKIEAKKGEAYLAAHLKLIYAGNILCDESIIGNIGLDDTKYVVCLVNKPRPVPVTTLSLPNAQTTAAIDIPAAAVQTQIQGVLTTGLAFGEEYTSMVEKLTAMGYDVQEVIQALQASFHNPERAVEYLVNGIPDSVLADVDRVEISGEPDLEDSSGSDEEEVVSTQENALRDLIAQQEFRDLIHFVRVNPNLLPTVLEHIRDNNPEVYNLLTQHPDEFSAMITQTPGVPGLPQEVTQAITVTLSPQDVEAIERLKDMGFPEDVVLEAYIACEKNEQLAAEFLASFPPEQEE